MNTIKRKLGYIWLVLGPIAIALMVYSAFHYIGSGTGDISKPLPWFIIITIFTPVAIGLSIFGWYVVKGEYEV
jgi:hypothetical protein